MTPSDGFLSVLQHVMGQALDAAQYRLEDQPMQQARGLYRYSKHLESDLFVFIEFQTLYHPQSELSRFRINLLKNDQPYARAGNMQIEHDLAYVIWHEYESRVLPADMHWWTYKFANDLAPQLIEAGKLLFAYGVPWLEGSMDIEGDA